jgi:hypothetical protein
MKSFVLGILWLCLAVSPSAQAETFYGPTVAGNHFLIASNEAAIISSVMSADTLACDLLISNISYAVRLSPSGSARYAIAGPAELRVPGSGALYFKRVQNAGIRTVLLAGNDVTNGVGVSVPAGKSVEFFSSLDGDVTPNAFLVKSGQGSNAVQVAAGQRLDGPADIRFLNSGSLNVASFSYWFVEDVFQNPALLISSQAQAPQIIVEKSSDLTGWQPVAFFGQSLGSNTFYRLRISR